MPKGQSRDWWLHARITPEHDARRHITKEDKAYIQKLHKEGQPIREIARIFEGRVSRRSIQFILFPERLAQVKARQIEVKRWEAHNGTDERREVMRKYRKHIRQVYNLPGQTPAD
jgi:IS30 family transposase